MIANQKVLALIPARGGSKRLPRKNVLPLSGKPLISWTIEAAVNSSFIDRTIVSTDDKEIMDVSKKYTIEVPELRPISLSTDESSSLDVILHILNKYRKDEDILILLQPTSPLRTHVHIDSALQLFAEKKADTVISVTECEHSPLWANTLPEMGSMENFLKSDSLRRSQELEQYYRLNGAIYIFDINELLKNKKIIYSKKTFSFKMDKEHSVDIDTITDFEYAEFLISRRIIRDNTIN